MQLTIRRYQDPDKETVRSLFARGTEEHIWPCFKNAMSSPLYLCFTLGLGIAGYLLASGLGALLLLSGWAGLVYYCCHKFYATYVRETLRTDLQDIAANYMAQPDDCFWVAETAGERKVVGMVAVVARRNGAERYGELFRMSISPAVRQTGLGSRMTQTVVDFCKQRGMSKVALTTTSSQTAAIALYQKMGFKYVRSHTPTGLGSRMTQTVVDFCKQRGMSKVALTTTSSQTAAIALYQKMGNNYCLTFEVKMSYEINSRLRFAGFNGPTILQTSCPDCLVLKKLDGKDIKLLSRRKQLNADELKEFETQVACYGGKKPDVFEVNEPSSSCINTLTDYNASKQYFYWVFKKMQPMDFYNCIFRT
ncbi:hypothetical protein CRUP_017329 [Coryphaenoides rupestris]|nr:hypothetical protein CRUP_017329 [Coryphaenoides rupestris]